MLNVDKDLKNSGFTLVELLIVIAIIAVLAALIFVALNPLQRFRDARNAKRKQDIISIADAIRLYQVSHGGQLPIGLDSNWRMLGTDTSGCDVTCGDLIGGGGGGGGSSSIVDDTQAEFNDGANSNTQWDNSSLWLELTSAGQTAGSGIYTSSIKDSSAATTTWSTLSWIPQRPTGKELPNNGGVETAYGEGNISMSGNVLLMHLNESSGNLLDSSGLGNNATALSGLTYGVTGKLNTAVQFNGINGYARVNDSPSLNPGSQSFSVSLWFQWNGAKPSTVKLLYSKNYLYAGAVVGSSFRYALAPNWVWAGANTFSVTPNQWYHATIVYNKTNQYLYQNGQLVYSLARTDDIGTNSENFYLGTRLNNVSHLPGEFFPGIIDEFAIFSRALSATEVTDIYRRGALRLKHQVRSCDDNACSGENFIGPDGTANTFYSETPNNAIGLPSLSLSNVNNNRYFQYRSTLETDGLTLSPELKSITFNYSSTGGGSSASGTLQSSCLDLSTLLGSQLPYIPQDPSTGSAGKSYYAIKRQTSGQINVKSCSAEGGESINTAK